LLAGIGLLAAGCTLTQPPAPAPAPASGPRAGGVFREPVTDDPWDYDMSYTGSSITNPYLIKRAYSTLLRFRTGPNTGYSETVVEPLLAEKWEVSPDATTYTFQLR